MVNIISGVTVYKLDREQNGSPWVLKKVSRKGPRHEEMSMRLKIEASILKTLNHPNIVGFRALLQESDGRKCIAMEDCTISLGDLIEKRVYDDEIHSPFPADKIEKVLKDVAEGLNYLHNEALVLHCDIKSYNILVKNEFQICKICDFGVSMPLKKDGTLDYSKAGDEAEFVGTDPWCAPEILQEGQVITVKADIFAYGLCLWEMIALKTPYVTSDDDSQLNDSKYEDDSEDDEAEEELLSVRKRPKVPCEYLDDTYLPILQIYYLCTEQDYKKRPNSKDLCKIIKELTFEEK